MNPNNYPTDFAIAVAIQAKLIHKGFSDYAISLYGALTDLHGLAPNDGKANSKTKAAYLKAHKEFNLLATFQKMAAMSDFATAAKIYDSKTLNEEQNNALDLIAQITPTWVKGEVVDRLLTAIDKVNKLDQKALAPLAQTLIDAMKNGNLEEGTNKTKAGKTVKSLFFEFTEGDGERPDAK